MQSEKEIEDTTSTGGQIAEMGDTAAFKAKLTKITISSIPVLSLAVGSKLGLFDLMAQLDKPKTAQEIADAGGFRERFAITGNINNSMQIFNSIV